MTGRTNDPRRTRRSAMWLNTKHWALCCVALGISVVSAGTVEQAIILADPQMQVKDGAVQGCGYRLKAIPQSFDGRSPVLALDASFNLYFGGIGLMKGGAIHSDFKDGKPQPTTKPIENFWLKAQGDKPTSAVNGKVLAADTPGYLLYGATVDSVLALYRSVADGTPLTLGVRLKGEGIDRIYSGVVQISDADRRQGRQCLGDLLRETETASAASRSGK